MKTKNKAFGFEGLLQVYVEVGGYKQAFVSAESLVSLLEPFLPIQSVQIEPYWKIKEYHGITLKFKGYQLRLCFEQLLKLLATGWHPIQRDQGSNWAVWNPSDSAVFNQPSVRWANLELWPLADVTQQT